MCNPYPDLINNFGLTRPWQAGLTLQPKCRDRNKCLPQFDHSDALQFASVFVSCKITTFVFVLLVKKHLLENLFGFRTLNDSTTWTTLPNSVICGCAMRILFVFLNFLSWLKSKLRALMMTGQKIFVTSARDKIQICPRARHFVFQS